MLWRGAEISMVFFFSKFQVKVWSLARRQDFTITCVETFCEISLDSTLWSCKDSVDFMGVGTEDGLDLRKNLSSPTAFWWIPTYQMRFHQKVLWWCIRRNLSRTTGDFVRSFTESLFLPELSFP